MTEALRPEEQFLLRAALASCRKEEAPVPLLQDGDLAHALYMVGKAVGGIVQERRRQLLAGYVKVNRHSHLRGKVKVYPGRSGRPVYAWYVVNTRTGRHVAGDNACLDSLSEAIDRARHLVTVCTEVHRREILLEGLKE